MWFEVFLTLVGVMLTRKCHRQVGQGTANEVELRDLRAELEGKEEKHEQEKGKQTNTAQGEPLRA